jgi:type II secretory pathway pseudopilin PulG
MRRNAFTLLEVVLALALGAVTLGILGMAVDIHLTAADTGRAEVEQAQLARTLLHRIADDLRAAPPYSPPPADADASMGSSSSSPSTPADSNDTSSEDNGSDASKQGGSSSTQAGTPSVLQQYSGGLHGISNQLQLGVSRLPRPKQALATPALESSGLTDHGGDSRTVAYFVAETAAALLPDTGDASAAVAPRCGLLRCEMETAAFSLASQLGASDVTQTAEVLAREVLAIDFKYTNGTEWLAEWDSEIQGKLPTAVKVTMTFRRPQRRRPLVSFAPTVQPSDVVAYSLVAELPNARAVDVASENNEAGDHSPSGGGKEGGQ